MKGFLGSGALETAMSVSFVYLLLATFCSTANEWIATLLQARADTLKATLRELLNHQNIHDGTEFLKAFYEHPIVTSMMQNCRHPSYLPSRAFTTAVVDLATSNIHGSIDFAGLEASLAAMPRGDVKTVLQALIQNAAGDLSRAETNIENWFNDAMARASAEYKRRTRLWTAAIASLLTVAVNADTIAMVSAHSTGTLGWTSLMLPAGVGPWLTRICGWALTVAAVSLGAPFWFDIFNRFVTLRTPERPASSQV